jgi:hypothetical protein
MINSINMNGSALASHAQEQDEASVSVQTTTEEPTAEVSVTEESTEAVSQ